MADNPVADAERALKPSQWGFWEHTFWVVLFLTLAVLGMEAFLMWIASILGWPGLAAFVKHP